MQNILRIKHRQSIFTSTINPIDLIALRGKDASLHSA